MISKHAKKAEWTINHTHGMDGLKVQAIIQAAIDADRAERVDPELLAAAKRIEEVSQGGIAAWRITDAFYDDIGKLARDYIERHKGAA